MRLTQSLYSCFLFMVNLTRFHSFFLLMAIFFLSQKNYWLSVFLFSLAIVIKTWPAIFLASFFRRLNPKKLIFLTLTLPLILIVIYLMIFGGDPLNLIKTIIKYRGVWGIWGWSLMIDDWLVKWQKILGFVFLIGFLYFSFF